MTLYQFNQLPYQTQLGTALCDGSFLARRWQSRFEVVNLYALHGFFVETVYHTAANELLGLRSFSDPDVLEEYAGRVLLPDWLN